MRVYDVSLNQFFNIDTKEELTPSMGLVSQEDEKAIKASLEDGGYVWKDGIDIRVSGTKPTPYSKFNTDTKSWEIDESKREEYLARAREEVWEKIKQRRSESIETGVYHARLQKWFHTDSEAQRNYALMGHAISSPLYQPKRWKTMDGTFIEMTREVFQDVLALALKKADDDYRNAEIHKAKVMASTDPLAYDYSTGWSAGYTKGQ